MILKFYLITLGVVSVLTLIAFAADKVAAKKDGRRVPEIVLLTLIASGGAMGGALGMYLLRHKTNPKTKFHFAVTLWLSLAVTAALFLWLAGTGGAYAEPVV